MWRPVRIGDGRADIKILCIDTPYAAMQSRKHVAHIAEPIKHNLLAIEIEGFSLARAIIDFTHSPAMRRMRHATQTVAATHPHRQIPVQYFARQFDCAVRDATNYSTESRKPESS